MNTDTFYLFMAVVAAFPVGFLFGRMSVSMRLIKEIRILNLALKSLRTHAADLKYRLDEAVDEKNALQDKI